MKIFISSDHHFDHRNIPNFCPESRGRFASDIPGFYNSDKLEEMNEEIILKHNELVSEDDLTYILGDFAFCSPAKAMGFMERLNGKKVLIHGNHDRNLLRSTEFEFRKVGAGIVEDAPYMTVQYKGESGSAKIVLFHFPIEEWDSCHYGSIHLHGHQHGSGVPSKYRRMDVGVDTNDLKPYLLSDIVELMKTRAVYAR